MADIPRKLGAFTLERELGRGGFGTVYLGVDEQGRRAAVKQLHPDMVADARARALFRREVSAARTVRDFCTAVVLDADPDAPSPWIASEYIEGPTLRADVRDSGPRSGGDLERLAVQTATALTAIHAADVVHRDLKPDNIILGADGPRVIDFGVARVAQRGPAGTAPVGTIGYMAPEQLLEREITDRADVFAWGATLVFAGTGRSAFPGSNEQARLARVLHVAPELRGLDGDLRRIAELCLSKDAELRPSANDLLDMLLGRAAVAAADGEPADTSGTLMLRRGAARTSSGTATRPAVFGPGPQERLSFAERRLLAGDAAGAAAPLEEAAAGFEASGDAGQLLYTRIVFGDLWNVAGDHGRAWAHLGGLRAELEAEGRLLHLARALRGMALLDHGTLWEEEAHGLRRILPSARHRTTGVAPRVALARRSVELFAEVGRAQDAARARLVFGQVLSEAGDARGAADAFAQAVAGYEASGPRWRWWEARARRIAAQTRFHAIMEPRLAVGTFLAAERDAWELPAILANARRAARLGAATGDHRERLAAQITLSRVVWTSMGSDTGLPEAAGALPTAVTPRPSAVPPGDGPSGPTGATAAASAWYEQISTSQEVRALLESTRGEAEEKGLDDLAAQAELWARRLFAESPGVHAVQWQLSRERRAVPFAESGLTRGDRCAI
ncbi:protein kinase domain-containing protein [Nocardiopsis coralliicola]